MKNKQRRTTKPRTRNTPRPSAKKADKVFDNSRYNFDLVEITTPTTIGSLHSQLQDIKAKINENTYRFQIEKIQNSFDYKTKITLTGVKQEALVLLSKHKGIFTQGLQSYKISKLEISRDTTYNSKDEAIHSFENKAPILHRKWSVNNNRLLECMTNSMSFHGDIYFYNKTLYLGNYVLYPRYSKINKLPIVHEEIRLTGQDQVTAKTGIYNIDHLISFDFKAFWKQEDERIVQKKIAMETLGRWLLGLDGRRKLKRSNYKPKARAFLEQEKIQTYPELVMWFKKEKQLLKKTPGKKTDLDVRVLELRSYSKFAENVTLNGP